MTPSGTAAVSPAGKPLAWRPAFHAGAQLVAGVGSEGAAVIGLRDPRASALAALAREAWSHGETPP